MDDGILRKNCPTAQRLKIPLAQSLDIRGPSYSVRRAKPTGSPESPPPHLPRLPAVKNRAEGTNDPARCSPRWSSAEGTPWPAVKRGARSIPCAFRPWIRRGWARMQTASVGQNPNRLKELPSHGLTQGMPTGGERCPSIERVTVHGGWASKSRPSPSFQARE